MMIPPIARRLIEMYSTAGRTLLDPFCGSGTALVEARMAHLNSYGLDINPLALLIARAKTRVLSPKTIQKQALVLLKQVAKDFAALEREPDCVVIPEFYNIHYWFKPSVSQRLCILRSRIFEIPDESVREFFLVAFSETVRDCSNTRRGEFKLFRMPKAQLDEYDPDVGVIFFGKVARNLRGLAQFMRRADTNVWVSILAEDTRNRTSLPSKCVDIVVTSPPYGDSKTTVAYGQFSRLSLQWLGLGDKEARTIDDSSLGGKKRLQQVESVSTETLDRILREVSERDKRRASDVARFHADFAQCLKEIHRVCKDSATVCLVVGNRTVKGIRIPTDCIVVELAEKQGFCFIESHERNIPNKRMPSKNSPTNVRGVLGETMTRERIVVLRKKANGHS